MVLWLVYIFCICMDSIKEAEIKLCLSSFSQHILQQILYHHKPSFSCCCSQLTQSDGQTSFSKLQLKFKWNFTFANYTSSCQLLSVRTYTLIKTFQCLRFLVHFLNPPILYFLSKCARDTPILLTLPLQRCSSLPSFTSSWSSSNNNAFLFRKCSFWFETFSSRCKTSWVN